MKKTFRFLTCLATVAVAASCLQENLESNQPETKLVPMTFSAAVDDSNAEEEARTSLNADFTVTWSETESISLFSGTSHTEFTMTSKSDDSKSAVFEGLAEQTGTYHAVYPHSAEHSMSGGMLTVNLAATQAATADGFADDVNLSAATSTSTDLQFRNVGALVGVTVGNDNIKSVILTATEEDSYLAGKATLEFVDGLPKATATEGSASVTLNGDFENGKTYYFVVYPGSYTGLEITYVDAEGKAATKTNPNTLTLTRNGNATLGTIEMTEFYGYTAGEDLFIGGEGAEAGRKLLYVTEGYYNTGDIYTDKLKSVEEGNYNYYEIYTSLKAGKPYFFYTGTSDKRKLLIKGNELATVATEAEAAATVETDGVYRIRINPANNKVGLATVSKVVIRRTWDAKDAELSYVGNGVWRALDYNLNGKGSDFVDERYRFIMTISNTDGSNSQAQGWSQNTRADGNPNKDADKSFWYMKPTNLSQWDNVWKYPAWLYDKNDPERWYADVNFYMNADVDHYTHEFVNEWAFGSTEEWMQDYGLKIGGEGSEAGQAFTLITPSSYYNTGSNYADRIGNIDNNTTYFEIFTKIEAGKPYYFYSDPLSTYYFKTDEFSKANNAEEASATVGETGIYRIRVNLSTKEIGMEKVNQVMYDNPWGNDKDTELTYQGKGVWGVSQFNIRLQVVNWGHARCDNRYKFNMTFHGHETIQGLGGMDGANGYWIQPTNGGDWDEKLFGLPSSVVDMDDEDRYTADITLYMNNDKGHYTHEFTNIVDNNPLVHDFDLYIGGTGSEDGQKFRYITSNSEFYNTSTGDPIHYGDLVQPIDEGYYEIFTKLKANEPYYFVTGDGAFYSAETFEEVADAEAASATVDADNVYRIRIDLRNKVIYKKIVQKIELFVSQTQEHKAMTYQSKGVWYIPEHTITWGTASWGIEERYRFKITWGDNSVQPMGISNNITGSRPDANTGLEYWKVQPCQTGQWTGCFKIPAWLFDSNNNSRYKSDITLYLNAENTERDYYYHEFTNTVDTLSE